MEVSDKHEHIFDVVHLARQEVEDCAKTLLQGGRQSAEIFHDVHVEYSESLTNVSATSLNGKRQIEATAYSAGRLTYCVKELRQKGGMPETTLEVWANTIFNEDKVLQYFSSRARLGCLVGEPAKEEFTRVSEEFMTIIESQRRYTSQSKAGQFITRLFAR